MQPIGLSRASTNWALQSSNLETCCLIIRQPTQGGSIGHACKEAHQPIGWNLRETTMRSIAFCYQQLRDILPSAMHARRFPARLFPSATPYSEPGAPPEHSSSTLQNVLAASTCSYKKQRKGTQSGLSHFPLYILSELSSGSLSSPLSPQPLSPTLFRPLFLLPPEATPSSSSSAFSSISHS